MKRRPARRRPRQYPEQQMLPTESHKPYVRLTVHEADVLRDAVNRLWLQLSDLEDLTVDLPLLAVRHHEVQVTADRLHNELIYVRTVVDRAGRAGVYSDHPSANATAAPPWDAARPGLDFS